MTADAAAAGFDLERMTLLAWARRRTIHLSSSCSHPRRIRHHSVTLGDHLDPERWCARCAGHLRDAITIWLRHRDTAGFGVVAGHVPFEARGSEASFALRALCDVGYDPQPARRLVTVVPAHVGRFAAEFGACFRALPRIGYLPAGGPDPRAAAFGLTATAAALWDADPDASAGDILERAEQLAGLATASRPTPR